jgi:hypothetical protein
MAEEKGKGKTRACDKGMQFIAKTRKINSSMLKKRKEHFIA